MGMIGGLYLAVTSKTFPKMLYWMNLPPWLSVAGILSIPVTGACCCWWCGSGGGAASDMTVSASGGGATPSISLPLLCSPLSFSLFETLEMEIELRVKEKTEKGKIKLYRSQISERFLIYMLEVVMVPFYTLFLRERERERKGEKWARDLEQVLTIFPRFSSPFYLSALSFCATSEKKKTL